MTNNPFVGSIGIFGNPYKIDGWMPCNGTSVSIGQYAALYAIIGTTYGGNGRDSFQLPDLRGRTPIGADPSKYPVGMKGGSEGKTVTIANMPAHKHDATVFLNVDIQVADNEGNNFNASNNALGMKAIDAQQTPQHEIGVYNNKALTSNSLQGLTYDYTLKATNAGGEQAVNNMQPSRVVGFFIAVEGIYPPPS